jgi:hypothetical protein
MSFNIHPAFLLGLLGLSFHPVYADTQCKFGVIRGDLNAVFCQGIRVKEAAPHYEKFVGKDQMRELRIVKAGEKLDLEFLISSAHSILKHTEITELNVFYRLDDEEQIHLVKTFSQRVTPSVTTLTTSLMVPTSAQTVFELFANVKDSQGREVWINNQGSQDNFQFLVIHNASALVELRTPLEKNISVSLPNQQSDIDSFQFAYEMQRATDLGVPPLFYKAGETRNTTVYLDYIGDDGSKLLGIEMFGINLAAESWVRLPSLPILDDQAEIRIKVYSQNYTTGRSCGASPSDFKGCDDNFGQSHVVKF